MAWHLIAHASDLANPGDFVCLPVGPGREIAATRLPDGELMVFDNRCPHRGARIFTEMFGNRPPRCGYHGRCARADDVATVPWVEFRGWVFASDTPVVEDLPTWRYSLPDLPALQRHSVFTLAMQCHWTVAVENALDFEHVATVHPHSLHPLQLTRGVNLHYGGGSSEEHFLSDSPSLATLRKIFPEADPAAADYRHLFMFPYTALSSTAGAHYSLQHYFPGVGNTTRFIHRLYLTPCTEPRAGDVIAGFNRRVFEEDDAVCALVAPWHRGAAEPRIEAFRNYATAHEVSR